MMRQDFVATLSHELRTPLTGMLGYLELLVNRWHVLDDEKRRAMLGRAQSSAARLEQLVTDLLLFSHLEQHESTPRRTVLRIDSLVERAVDEISTTYRGQVVRVTPSSRPAWVRADARYSVQVLVNLLDNAIKYSSPGSPVHVRWMLRREEIHVAVRDQGPGIVPEDIERLFARFGTLGHQPRPGHAGTGIGLYLCKRLLEAMEGRIWVRSRPGKGSTFHFSLPRADDGGTPTTETQRHRGSTEVSE
jgi:two-component system phosphate regulon sensor histidine kinase PhoR